MCGKMFCNHLHSRLQSWLHLGFRASFTDVVCVLLDIPYSIPDNLLVCCNAIWAVVPLAFSNYIIVSLNSRDGGQP